MNKRNQAEEENIKKRPETTKVLTDMRVLWRTVMVGHSPEICSQRFFPQFHIAPAKSCSTQLSAYCQLVRGSPKSPDVNVTSMGCMEYTCVPGIARRAGLTCGASCILNNHGHVGNFTGIWIFSSRYTYMGYRQSGMGIHGGRPTHPPIPTPYLSYLTPGP